MGVKNNVSVQDITGLRRVRRHANGYRAFVFDPDALYKFDPSSTAADDGTLVVRPDNVLGTDAQNPGRWTLIPISGISEALAKEAVFQALLQRDSTVQVSLQRFGGDAVEVNGEIVDPGASGLTLLTTDKLITAAGLEAAGAMTASGFFHVYVPNSQASFSPLKMRASITAPSFLNGVKYLGTSGNAANWRFAGWLRTNPSTEFVDTLQDRLVVNEYNGIWKPLYLQPGYVDDNAGTTYTQLTAFAEVNGGTGARGSFISNGRDAVRMIANMVCENTIAGHSGLVGIGIDSSTVAGNIGLIEFNHVDTFFNISCAEDEIHAEGYHTYSLLGARPAGGVMTIAADIDFTALVGPDVPATYLVGRIKV